MRVKLLVLFLLFFSISCQRKNIKLPEDAMRISGSRPNIEDDLSYKSLRWAIHKNAKFLLREYKKEELQFGNRLVSKNKYAIELFKLLKRTRGKDFKYFKNDIESNFEFFEVYGGVNRKDDWSDVLVTSYFEPVLSGSLKRTKKYNYPLYEKPKDLVFVDLSEYLEKLPQLDKFKSFAEKEEIDIKVLRGRIENTDTVPKITPYFSRNEIRSNHREMLKNTKVIAWVEPIEAFFLQIQGSGTIRFSKKNKIRVGYAGQNGHPYEAIGKYLLDVIPKEEMSLQKIESHLKTLTDEELHQILDKNPSYVFFQKLNSAPITYMGAEVINGRTIATDFRLFPKGALAFLSYEKPIFENKQSTEPTSWQPSSRFVIDQDTGGAIRGAGRVDLFWGSGPRAKQAAGVMKNPGHLYYLFPKNVEFKTVENN